MIQGQVQFGTIGSVQARQHNSPKELAGLFVFSIDYAHICVLFEYLFAQVSGNKMFTYLFTTATHFGSIDSGLDMTILNRQICSTYNDCYKKIYTTCIPVNKINTVNVFIQSVCFIPPEVQKVMYLYKCSSPIHTSYVSICQPYCFLMVSFYMYISSP